MNSTRFFPLFSSAIFSLGLLLALPALAQTDRHVDAASGSDSGNDCANVASPCATIAHAVGQSIPGDRVLVMAGVYTESLAIDRNIEIVGGGEGETIIQAAAGPAEVTQRVFLVEPGQRLELAHLTVRHGFADGSSSSSRRGGGIYVDGGELDLAYVVLEHNRAHNAGGAIYNDGGTVTMLHTDLRNNIARNLSGAGGNGGAITLVNGASVDGLNSYLRGNEAARGGAIHTSSGSSLILTNVALTGNSTTNHGGAVVNVAGQPQFTNVVFSANRTDGEGGGLYSQSSGAAPLIRNSVFWNNQDSEGIGSPTASIFNSALTNTSISHSLVQGCGASGGGWNEDCGEDMGGNRPNQNPNFIDPVSPASAPTSQGYFRQNTGSPVIGQGNNSYIAGVNTDLDGWQRIIDGVVDLGAYEFGNDILFRDRFEEE